MRASLIIGVFATVLAASGCDRSPAPAAPATTLPASEPVVGAAATQPTAAKALWLEPASLSSCAKGEVVTVHWDPSGFPDVKRVDVTSPAKGGTEATFAKSGPIGGSKQTGPWMKAGVSMILRDQADGHELARVVMGSLPCGQ